MAEMKVKEGVGTYSPDKMRKLQMVLSNFQESYNYLKNSRYFEDHKAWHNMYKSIPKAKPYYWMSNIFIPLIHAKVEAALSTLMSMFFQNKPAVEIRARPFGKGDAIHAGIWRQLLDKQVESTDFFQKFTMYVKTLIVYGTAIAKVYWSNVTRKVKYKVKVHNPVFDVINALTGANLGADQYKEAIAEIKDGPTFDVLNIGDTYPDPMAIDVGDGWIIHKFRRSIDYLRQRRGPVYNDEVLRISPSDCAESKDGKYEIEGDEGRQTQALSITRPDLANTVEVLEWVGHDDINGDGKLERCIYVVAAGKYLIRDVEYPLWTTSPNNYVKSNYVSLPNSFLGVGIPEEGGDLQNGFNEFVNQRFDNVSFILNPMMFYNVNGGVKTKNLVAKPGGVYGSEDGKGVTFDRPPDVTGSSFNITLDFERWLQEVTIPKITQGMSGSELNDTATGMAILQKGATDKISLIAKNVESSGFCKLVQLYMDLDYQFYTAKDIARIVGVDESLIDMELMRPDYYEIVPSGVKSFMERNQKALKLLQYMNLAKAEPDFDMRKALNKYYQLLDISDNPNELLRTPEQAMAIRQMQFMQQTMMPMMMSAAGSAKVAPGSGKGSESTQFTGMEGGATTPGTPPLSGQTAPPPEPGAQ